MKIKEFRKFQLTPPIQRATTSCRRVANGSKISTHAPYTEGDFLVSRYDTVTGISTHAPYTEGDSKKQAI